MRTLGPMDLHIPAGQRVAVLGKRGSGKTTLLEVLASPHVAKRGSIHWDGRTLTADDAAATAREIALLPHSPKWPRRRIREMLDLPDGGIDDGTRNTLGLCGAKSLLKRLPNGSDTKLGSSDLSSRERVALALATLVRGNASLWLLDDPVAGLEKRKARKVIKHVLGAQPDTTVIVTLSRPVRLGKFDRVIVLKRGRVAFDGTPNQWRAASTEQADTPGDTEEASTPIAGTKGES